MGLETGILVTRQIAELNGILIGNDLTTGTKNALRIGSPSLVYRDIGADVIAGLAQGISTFLPNLNSIVSAMVNIFINAASQITSVMNMIRMQVFQIQGYIIPFRTHKAITTRQPTGTAAMISADTQTAVRFNYREALLVRLFFHHLNHILVKPHPQTTSTTTTNHNTTVSGDTKSYRRRGSVCIDDNFNRSVKGGIMSWN
jgi:hypothetical protein